MTKKIIAIFMLVIIIFGNLAISTNAYAKEEQFPYFSDELDVCSIEAAVNIEEKLTALSDKYDFDVVVTFFADLYSDTAEASADDIYDERNYGRGENRDGIMFFLSVNDGKYHFSTCGYGIKAFNSAAITKLKKEVEPLLKENKFEEAVLKYIEVTDMVLGIAKSGGTYKDPAFTTLLNIVTIVAAIAIPFAVAAALTYNKVKQMNTSVTNDYATNYMKEGSMNLNREQDIFLYSTVHKTEKKKEDSGSHTSSSGTEHGGGGGSF